MSSQYGAATTRISQRTVYDPNRGFEVEEVWRGDPTQVATLANAFMVAGARAQFEHEDGIGTCTAYIGLNESAGAEKPVDNWKISKDYVQTSIWNHPAIYKLVKAEADLLFGNPTSNNILDTMASMRSTLEAALQGKIYDTSTGEFESRRRPPISLTDSGFTGNSATIYSMMLQGVESFEFERCVLRRVRSYSVNYATRIVLETIPTVYTTASFISQFLVPTVIQAQLPATPGADQTPVGTNWAWKVRGNESSINYFGKVEEVTDFVFAAWETALYTVA